MLNTLLVKHFRIFDEKKVRFYPGINIILGENGVGKTSLLEAVYFMNFTKSFKAPRDENMVRIGKDHFQVHTEWENAGIGSADGNFLKGKGKRFILDGETLERITDVVGNFPMVFQSPEDYRVTAGPGGERRIYFDRFISQLSREYLQDLMRYRKILRNRNACCKQLSESGKFAYTRQLEIYDIQLLPVVRRIVNMRERVAEMFNRRLETLYSEIFSGESPGRIRYRPSLNSKDTDAELRRHIRELAGKEIALHRTLWGPNYDKYVFYRGDTPLIHYASQGEHKIWMTLLKLAEGDIIRNDAGKEPLYLFDDLFAELDVNNSRRIVENIMLKQQALITTTDLNDLRRHGIDTSRGNIHLIEIR